MIREWIIFALCLGAGGHIALAVMLHAPNLWPWSTAGFYGLMTGIILYALVQGGRVLWKVSRRSHSAPCDKPGSIW
jgi:predicted anti-sigma-YlaC factor YlaD